MPDDMVTSVLARGLADPHFARLLVSRSSRHVAVSGAEQAVLDDVDHDRLALFAGLITKVRHSDVFEFVPGTLALLRLYGLELAAFRDYFLEHGRPGRDRTEKVRSVMDHFARFASTRQGRRVRGLSAVVAHERCAFEIATDVSRHATAGPNPRIENARVVRMQWDPVKVLEACMRGKRVRETARRNAWMLYWGDRAAGTLQTLQVDRPTAALVSAIDGTVSLDDACAHVARRCRISRRALSAIAAELEQLGIVSPPGSL